MTPEEREQLEKDYPSINFPRMAVALAACGLVAILAWAFMV